MTANSSTGSKVYISAAKPATYDATGYGAISWTEIGEITKVGEIGGERGVITHKALAGYVIKRAGIPDPGSTTLEAAADSDNAGQALALSAYKSGKVHYFKVAEYESGDIHYGPAIVTSCKRNIGGVDEMTSVSIKLDMSAEGGTDWVMVNGTPPA